MSDAVDLLNAYITRDLLESRSLERLDENAADWLTSICYPSHMLNDGLSPMRLGLVASLTRARRIELREQRALIREIQR